MKMKAHMKQIVVAVFALMLSVSAYAKKENSKETFNGKTLVELSDERRTKPLADHNGDEHLLLFLEREIMRLFEEGNLDKAFTYLTENAMVNPPGVEAIFGRENQKMMFKELLTMEGFELSWEPIQAHVGEGAKMGYVYGLVRWKMPNEKVKLGKYISIYVKKDGKWLNEVEMRNIIAEEK
ncbi:nuclear transport factor 2 family protein [Marinifilum sp. JC070]|uniref:Nuclear transport factor 2 family protein n=2 Tax=Marinifilum caeruleilacunae TaxID=2499076 RepID=A0ABX1WZW4_9BACT|nr:nuclear transport factor 2 family protein [Marinifilum caeruleilacunae]